MNTIMIKVYEIKEDGGKIMYKFILSILVIMSVTYCYIYIRPTNWLFFILFIILSELWSNRSFVNRLSNVLDKSNEEDKK